MHKAAVLTLLALAWAVSTAAAQGAPSTPPAPAGVRLELGAEHRARTENWDNLTDFDADVVDARHQWRFRTRAWAKLDAGATSFAVGLVNESRKLTTPRTPLTLDETVFETLHLEQRFGSLGLARVGRQNVTRGDGFILMDGGALDGSRASYVNAVDLAWTPGKARLDLFVISDPWRDIYLPRIHDQQKTLTEWDERAVGLYWSDPRRAGLAFDAYWFYKTELDDRRALSNAARQSDRRFHTLGARVVHTCEGGWTLTAELAGQAGTQEPSRDVRACGGQVYVKRAFAHATKPSLAVGFVGLSGDDPGTGEAEGWDPLFARYPKWSELAIYTFGSERGPSYWTDLAMWQAEARVTPVRGLDLRATYSRMDAFHRFAGKPAIYGGGTHRGDLFAARADYRVNDHFRGHVVGEHLSPGDFYAGSEPGWFFRAEVMFTFQHAFAL